MKPKPIRIQRSRQHKQVSPNGLPIVYVGRPSKWGNPFKVGIFYDNYYGTFPIESTKGIKIKTLKQCLKRYGKFIKELHSAEYVDLSELRCKNLSCWCALDKPCHADTLLELANK